MRTNQQNQASRTNGAKSKGPKTQSGKASSAANANTHNLAGVGALRLLSNECRIEFYNHQLGFIHRFQPIDIVEYDLVQKMITASWRLRRIEAMECSLMEIQMERQKPDIEDEFDAIDVPGRQVLTLFGTTDATQAFNLLLRYAASSRRAYATAFKLLKELQGDRFNQPNDKMPAFQTKDPDAGEPHESANTSIAEGHEESANPGAPSAAQATIAACSIRRREAARVAPIAPACTSNSYNAKLQSEPRIAVAGRPFSEYLNAA